MPYWSTLYLASEWATRFIVLVYVPQRRPAAAARTWLLLIFLLPCPGLVLCALFGRIRIPRARIEQQILASQLILQGQLEQKSHPACEPDLPTYSRTFQDSRRGWVFADNAVELLPDYEGSIALLYAARQRVVITTPYFVPDEPFLSALRSAARRGVEVRSHANQPFTQLAQRSYYNDLLAGGVHIPLYRPRFLHAKHLSVDDSIALIGSSNIDIRSFALNAEVSFIVYDPAVIAQLRAVQECYFTESDVLDLATWRQRPLTPRPAARGGASPPAPG